MAAAAADGAGPSNRALVAVEGGEIDLRVHPSGIVPQLQNVVATVDLGCKLDLKEIALQARNAEYNPKVCAPVAPAVVLAACCTHGVGAALYSSNMSYSGIHESVGS